jgi:hypothetical protein
MLSTVNGLDSFGVMSERFSFQQLNCLPQADFSTVAIPLEEKQKLLNVYREDLITLSFEVVYCEYMLLDMSYVKNAANNSPMILNALYCLGSLVAPKSAVPVSIGSRLVMAQIYFENSLSYLSIVLASPSEISVLSLFMLFLASLDMGKVHEAVPYFSLAISMAKEIGLNKEICINAMCNSEAEKENQRRLWWCLYLMDTFIAELHSRLIEDKDNQVYLPSEDNGGKEDINKLKYFGLQIMASEEWFTPGIPNYGLNAYRLLLIRISGRAMKFNYLTKYDPGNPQVANPLYIMGALQGSLRDWWSSLPDRILSHIALAQSNMPIEDPAYTWRVLYTCVQFNCVKSLINHPCMLKKILTNSITGVKSTYYIESVIVGHENALVLRCFLARNARFKYCTIALSNYMFNIAFPLVIASKLEPLGSPEHSKIISSLDAHLSSLRAHSIAYQCVPVLLETLEYLLSLSTPVEIISEYTRFRTSKGKTPLKFQFLNENPSETSTPPVARSATDYSGSFSPHNLVTVSDKDAFMDLERLLTSDLFPSHQ